MKENAFAKELRLRHGLKLGGYGDRSVAPNGEPYVVLQGMGGEDEAAAAFASFRETHPGSNIWWRTVPEILPRNYGRETFYMRLLIVNDAHAAS